MLLILVLVVLGVSHIFHRHVNDGVPLTPGQQIAIWQVEAEITFTGQGGSVTATFALPNDPNFELIEEFTASPAYGVSVERDDENSRVVWSKREASGRQTMYYQGSFKLARAAPKPNSETPPEPVSIPTLAEPYQSSAEAILALAVAQSGNQQTLVTQLIELLDSENQNLAMLRSRLSRTETFVHLLQMAEIPVNLVRGLQLEDGRRNQSLIPLVRMYVDGEWMLRNVELSSLDEALPLLIWLEGRPALLDVEGGENSNIRFAISEQRISALQDANQVLQGSEASIGLYNLPIAEQNMFKGILLLPLGALVVVFMRVIVGVRSSGTFMPILIAAAFIQTELLNGLIGFVTVVAVGLMIRSFLSHLNLLLVSRISAVVIVVIALILLFTIFAFQLGLTEALTITFFPMIIMAWTIERMSILWEEEGGREVLVQGGGSLLIAVLAYLMMDNDLLRHWAFNLLGIHALIMAAILLMGQYTGYRLLELQRFKPLSE